MHGRIWTVRIVHALSCVLPVRERIVLATAHDATLRGNLAAIHSELLRRRPVPKVVTVRSRPGRGIRGALGALVASAIAAHYLATSRLFVVDDYLFAIYVVKRRDGTRVIQTWHAAGALKKFGRSLSGKAFGGGASLVDRVAIHSGYDVCLVSSLTVVDHYANAFGLPSDRFISWPGVPGTDVLFGAARSAAEVRVRARYSIPPHRTTILYAPTFRGQRMINPDNGAYLDLRMLRDRLGHDHVLLLRLHPFVRSRLQLPPGLDDFVVDVSDHPEINELMVVSDVLITDYSSAMFDFTILERPVVVFAPDLARYEAERGFYVDFERGVPGPVFRSTADVADHIRRATFDLDRIRTIKRQSFDVADGMATVRFVDGVLFPMLRDPDAPLRGPGSASPPRRRAPAPMKMSP